LIGKTDDVGRDVGKADDLIDAGAKTGAMNAIDDIPTIHFDGSTPNISRNIREAQEAGQPSLLHRETNPAVIAANRAENVKGWKGPGSMDEYPFASTREGGLGATLAGVPLQEQRIQGGMLSSFYQRYNIGPGDAFRVVVDDF